MTSSAVRPGAFHFSAGIARDRRFALRLVGQVHKSAVAGLPGVESAPMLGSERFRQTRSQPETSFRRSQTSKIKVTLPTRSGSDA